MRLNHSITGRIRRRRRRSGTRTSNTAHFRSGDRDLAKWPAVCSGEGDVEARGGNSRAPSLRNYHKIYRSFEAAPIFRIPLPVRPGFPRACLRRPGFSLETHPASCATAPPEPRAVPVSEGGGEGRIDPGCVFEVGIGRARMIRILMLCAMVLSICGSAVAAEPSENGRYQAVTVEMGGTGLTPEVLILDTRDGHLWRYWQEPRMGKTQGSEGVKYLMQLRPGTKPGEVIGFETYRSPN